MNEDKGSGGTPPEEEPRTVFAPAGQPESPEEPTAVRPGKEAPPAEEERTTIAPAPTPADPAPATDERTVIAPASPAPPPTASEPAMPSGGTSMPTFSNFAPRTDGQGIQVGDVLNHIFEVKRFLARGGMGEVFEGINVNSEERVAIKVMLPALAADANVIALFRKEARTLTRLHHEALVQYRVLAQEPQLGVLYIVTEFIDGVNLSDVLGSITPDADELAGLLRRLASGLSVAHSLGAIHRDISPDNVLLEEGKLHKAKVIDFGIAKDLDPSSKTIVGEGFAGKLNYVAPEQLGDFGREVGPWTDVYSLALVILAVIMGRNVQMGGSLVDAVDKRRQGPDLSPVPDKLKPVLEAMLRPNPKDRIRSMDEVLSALDGAIPRPRPAGDEAAGSAAGAEPAGKGMPKAALFGAAAAGLAILGAGAWFAMGSDGGESSKGDPAQLATAAINQVLPTVECSWLDVGRIEDGDQVAIRMTGVAGDPTTARNKITQAVAGAGVPNAAVNFDEVAIIRPQGCSALGTFGKIRSTGELHMSVQQREFEMTAQPEGSQYPVASVAQVTFKPPEGKNFSLLGIEPNGALSQVLPDRQAFDQAVAENLIQAAGPGAYRLSIDMNHSGWSGLVLLVGDGPFDQAVTQPAIDARDQEWQGNFVATASERDWKSEMIWFKSVDKQPN